MRDTAWHTVMTTAISGRPARCVANRFTALGEGADVRQIAVLMVEPTAV